MSYPLATKLSHTNRTQCATVLTDSKVMVTCGLGVGQMMSLQDWIILSDGAIIQTVSTTPVDTPSPAPAPENIPTPPEPLAPHALLEAIPPAQIGSKFTWRHDNNSRIAIMTSKGLLQVKSIVNGETEIILNPGNTILKKMMFADEAAWRASLPEGGVVELVGPNKIAEPTPNMSNLSDVEKVEAYMKRYKIRDTIYETPSTNEKMEHAINSIMRLRKEINDIPLSEDLFENSPKRHKLTLKLKREIRCYNYLSNLKNSDENENTRPLRIGVCGKNHIYMYNTEKRMTYVVSTYKGKIAIGWMGWMNSSVKLYDSFAEFGEGNLYVTYRRKEIDLN